MAFLILRILELHTRKFCVIFVNKHTEPIEYCRTKKWNFPLRISSVNLRSTFCWLIWLECHIILSIQIMENISGMSRRLSIVYVCKVLVLWFMESSTLTVFYIFSFCLVFKLYKSSLQILQFILDHLIFLGSVDIGGYLIVALFERWILTLAHFSDDFFWPINCTCQACISYHILGVDNVPF